MTPARIAPPAAPLLLARRLLQYVSIPEGNKEQAMKTQRRSRTLTLTLVATAVLGGAGLVTRALAGARTPPRPEAAAFEAGAAERAAAQLPKNWRLERTVVSFDSMYRS